jgi:glycosyltransferase involved in cell wall biosynthesis
MRVSQEAKTRARTALVNLSPDFFVPNDAKLVVCLGEVSTAAGCQELVRLAMRMLDSDANIKFWISGIDRQARQIYSELRDHAWHREILIFGAFDDVDELLASADLVVVPNFHGRRRFLFPYIVSSGVPWIAPKEEAWCQRLGSDASPLMWSVPGQDLGSKLNEWYKNPEPVATAAAKVAQQFLRKEPPETSIDAWIGLFSNRLETDEKRDESR